MQYNLSGSSVGFVLSLNEIAWIRQAYPRLFYNEEAGKIAGYFDLHSSYKNITITDSYDLRIDLVRLDPPFIPQVFEVGNRIRKTSVLYNRPLIDLHQYEDNKLCLIRPDAFLKRFYNAHFILPNFFEIIKAVLYWQAYYERYGVEPWPAEEHGWK